MIVRFNQAADFARILLQLVYLFLCRDSLHLWIEVSTYIAFFLLLPSGRLQATTKDTSSDSESIYILRGYPIPILIPVCGSRELGTKCSLPWGAYPFFSKMLVRRVIFAYAYTFCEV